MRVNSHIKKEIIKHFCFWSSFFCLLQISVAQVSFDFETNDLSQFTQHPAGSWTVKDSAPLGGTASLYRKAPSGVAGTDNISTLVLPSRTATADTFRFMLQYRYGTSGTNVAATNRFAVFLAANHDAESMSLSDKSLDAYVVGVTGTSGNDTLKFFHQKDGALTTLITSLVKAKDKKLAVELIRSAQSRWTLRVSAIGDFSNLLLQGEADDTGDLAGSHIGFSLIYSTANSIKEMRIDEVYANIALRPLKIMAVQREGVKQLRCTLNKSMQQDDLVNQDNVRLYLFDNEDFTSIDSLAAVDSKTALITLKNELKSGNYKLLIENAHDEFGNIENAEFDFSLEVASYGDIIFSEIMANPNSPAGLPDEEYLELYNRTAEGIDLAGWKLEFGTRSATIRSGIIQAESYALIGTHQSEFGDTVALTGSRPALTNSGMYLCLKDAFGKPVARLTYSDAWYADDDKKQGGYSLEKIDVNNLQEQSGNWSASVDERGGTPGMPNSIAASNPDKQAPVCQRYTLQDNNLLQLEFNEVILGSSLQAGDFATELGSAGKMECSSVNPSIIQLYFPDNFVDNTLYHLTCNGNICDLSGNCISEFALPLGIGVAASKNNVVISEALFNPNVGGVDFVELYNNSDDIVQLSGAKIANRKSTTGTIDKHYTLPEYTLFPHDYVVVTTKPEVVQAQYYCQNPQAFITLSTMPSYPNESGCVTVLTASDEVVEDFYYTEKMHSSMLKSKKGVSLERTNPNMPASEASSWFSASQTVGFATPTYANSQSVGNGSDAEKAGIILMPEVFSPNGDGQDDVLYIDYNMPESGYLATVTVYNANGKPVRQLYKNALLGLSGRLQWDGATDGGNLATIGIYLIYFEAYTTTGSKKKYKKTCVVAEKL